MSAIEKTKKSMSKIEKSMLSILILLIPAFIYAQQGRPEGFEVMGLGGAGGMYTPASSPSDPDLMLVSCDMSGSYRSLDGGKSWEMIHSAQLNSSRTCPPMFAGDTIFWVSGGQLRMSTDKGETWKVAAGSVASLNSNVVRLSQMPGNPSVFFAGSGSDVIVSDNGGQSWKSGVKGTGNVTGLAVSGNTAFAAIGTQIWKSLDKGTSWNALTIPETNNEAITGMTAGAVADSQIVYAVVAKEGLLRSSDNGDTWTKVLSLGATTTDGTEVKSDLSDVLMPSNQVDVAYVNNRHQVFKTEDGGDTWQSVFRMDSYSNPGESSLPFNVEKSWVQTEIKWGYYITQHGLGINPGNPDIAMVTTQGDIYITKDGGETWNQYMNEKVGVLPGDPGTRYRSIGLEVTSSWNFYFDPYDTSRYYIAYTDIGFARTVDQGETWIHSSAGSGNWGNTYYNVAFDPDIKGKMFAAASNRHDIPHWTHISPNSSQHEGGIVISTNHGLSWVRRNAGLPKAPCTWVALDPASPAENRTLYAAMFGEGVYKSVDGGNTWTKKSNGLGNEGNLHVLQVQIHPKTGHLYAGITARRLDNQFPVAGGIWKSTDGGENWAPLTTSLGLKWPTYFALHPENSDIIYLSAATAPGAAQGGLYKTTNGGTSWTRILYDADFAKKTSPSYVHAMGVQIHPVFHDVIYLGSSHGLWVSTDAGANWVWFDEIPFKGAQNVAFDPKNPKLMYVNTFGGGVWKGFYLPAGYEEPATGIGEKLNNKFNFSVYPNPSNGNFKLALEGFNESIKIEVFNNLGNKVFEKEINSANEPNFFNINLNQPSGGIFHIRVTSNNQMVAKTFIVHPN